MRRRIALIAASAGVVVPLALVTVVRADAPLGIVAITPAADRGDARTAIVIGPAGQVYEPDGHGAWIRRHAGGISEELTTATRAGTIAIVGTNAGPPFKLDRGAWAAIPLGLHVKALLGTGSRPTAAVGKTVFALDRPHPTKLVDAPDVITALGASPRGVVVETDRGLVRLQRTWKPIKNAPLHVAMLLDDRWAIADHAILDLRSMKSTPVPAGIEVTAAIVVGEDLVVAAAAHGAGFELITLRAGKLDHEPVNLDHASPIAGIAADREGRVVVATRDGQLAVRDHGTWSSAQLREELPSPHAGSPPAVSK